MGTGLKYFSVLLLLSVLLPSCSEKQCDCDSVEHCIDTLYIVTPSTDLAGQMVSIQAFGVLPGNSPSVNKTNLQKAIDACSAAGAALYVTPAENGYPVDAGIVLKKNVSLIGAHGPTGRGTVNSTGDGPTGSLFQITDKSAPFITVQSATRISGIQFNYPDQAWKDINKIIEYPPTIQVSHEENVYGVTLRDLSFYGETFAMDFRSPGTLSCEQILFEDCYGYPLGGCFIAIDRCYDIPRILHCHVNPANMRVFHKEYNIRVLDKVVEKKNYTYWVNNTDNMIIMDVFAFGVYGGIYLGPWSYGQLTSFSFDCCVEGIHVCGDGSWNRNWDISQGAIVANLGADYKKVHPFVIEGNGHTAISNVEAFSCASALFTSVQGPNDFIEIRGSVPSEVTLMACHAQNYEADFPITIKNPAAKVRAIACIDKYGDYFDFASDGFTEDLPGDVWTTFDKCDSSEGWGTGFSGGVQLDYTAKTEGEASLSVSGRETTIFAKTFRNSVDARVDQRRGHFLLDVYVSDATFLNQGKQGAIEISSASTFDEQETSWPTPTIGSWQNGWNTLDLKMQDANFQGITDYHQIDYFRFYQLGLDADLTFKIDNMRFYEENK